ncbi:15-hydroxyprostaglandin dehydrogenase [NAD(+)], partial [Paramuricea clavata]
TAMIYGTIFAIDLMDTSKGGKGGNVVNMSSIAGLDFFPTPESSYDATKHGIVGFTRSMAQKIIQVGVRLNCICPSAVDTRMLRETFKNADVKEIFDSLGITIQRQVIININNDNTIFRKL